MLLQRRGDPEGAIVEWKEAVRLDPNNPMTHHLLGQAYRDMGKKEEAEHELKLAEQLQIKQDSHP